MVHVLCTRLNSAIEVERSREIYNNLKSILILLEMEQSQDYKAEKNKNLHLSDKINFDRFLHEGIMYIGMVNNLNSWVKPNSMKNVILRKTLNVLKRVRFQYRQMLRVRNQLCHGIIENGIREDIIFAIDNVIQETDELRFGIADEYEIDAYEVIEFYDWQSERNIRTTLQTNIDLLTDKIYHAMIKRYLTLYSILKRYRERATRFLRCNRKILKSSKLRRKQRRNLCCKYHFLKQLISCCHYVLSPNKVKPNKIFKNI